MIKCLNVEQSFEIRGKQRQGRYTLATVAVRNSMFLTQVLKISKFVKMHKQRNAFKRWNSSNHSLFGTLAIYGIDYTV